MKARGKRVSASPLDRSPKKSQALKVRNRGLSLSYYALSELRNKSTLNQGRRATLSLRACPWLSYHAPLALHDLQFRLLMIVMCFCGSLRQLAPADCLPRGCD